MKKNIKKSSVTDIRTIKKDISSNSAAKKKYQASLTKQDISYIDVADNAEFLITGWYESGPIAGTLARWTKKEASFLFNPGDSRTLFIHVVALPPDCNNESPLTISLMVNESEVSSAEVLNPGIVSFSLPQKISQTTEVYTVVISHTFKPMELRTSPDFRELGIAIKSISSVFEDSEGEHSIRKLFSDIGYLTEFQNKLATHVDPQKMLADQGRLNLVKRVILRGMRVYTAIQVAFNTFLVQQLARVIDSSQHIIRYLQEKEQATTSRLSKIDSELSAQKKSVLQIQHSIKKVLKRETPGYDQLADAFYTFQQDKLRGSYEQVLEKQKRYKPQIRKVQKLSETYPFIEAGFGRGEFIEILTQNNISNIIGVDTNSEYIKAAKEKGMDARHQDILEFMIAFDGNISGFSAFHLYEHLSFEEMFELTKIVSEKLAPGGVFLIETPNPENLQVGSYSFHYDHTHKQKLPPVFMLTILKFFHFYDIEIIYSSPKHQGQLDETETLLYGPQDYAIVGYKQS